MLYEGIIAPGHPDPANIRRLDLLPVPQIRRMHRVGAAIDVERLRDLSARLELRREELRQEIASYVPLDALDEFVSESSDDLALNCDSAEQIGRLLFGLLSIGDGQRLRRTKSGKRISTGKKQLETLKRDHPVVSKVLEYRECSKLKSTYTDKLPLIAKLHNAGTCGLCGLSHREQHYRVHTSILTTRTGTGRLASKNPNLQNIPIRTKLGAEVRAAFIAQPGTKLVSRDYSQIELRLLAHASQDANMLRIFREGGDIHLDTAMRAFNIPDPSQVDKMLHRAPCKNVNFGIVYGLQPEGLYDLMALTYATAGVEMPDWLTLEWCAKFISKWFELYPACYTYLAAQHYRARRYGVVWTMFGRVRRVPETRSCHERVIAAGLRQAGNMPIQGAAADIFKIGMARVEDRLEEFRAAGVHAEALLPIHDELLCEVDEEWSEEASEIVGHEMVSVTGDLLRVPIVSEGLVMDRWSKG